MNSADITTIGRDLLVTTLMLSLPAVAISLLVGGIISVFQTITSIQEQTLTFAPRIVAVAVILMVTLPWSIQVSTAFVSRMVMHMLEATQ